MVLYEQYVWQQNRNRQIIVTLRHEEDAKFLHNSNFGCEIKKSRKYTD